MSKQASNDDQAALAARAMEVKAAGAAPPDHPAAEDHAMTGLEPNPRPDYAPSGAFDAEGHRPVLERSRKVR